MRNYKTYNLAVRRGGMALLAVLFIVMLVAVLSMGYIAKSDSDFASGRNMLLREQMDQLAISGLEHARGLILNPQDDINEAMTYAGNGKWSKSGCQLEDGCNDFYDISVARISTCDYNFTSTAYHKQGSEVVGRSAMAAEVRLDPYIAFWSGASATSIIKYMAVYGDAYGAGTVSYGGTISGDIIATGLISISSGGICTGQLLRNSKLVISAPNISADTYSSQYYADSDVGVVNCSAETLAGGIVKDTVLSSGSDNPGGVRYCSGDLEIGGNFVLNGMLAVKGDLSVSGLGNSITAAKNFPAIVVGGKLIFKKGAYLNVNGLVKVGNNLEFTVDANNVHFIVNGGLFLQNGIVPPAITNFGTITVIAAPASASLEVWTSAEAMYRWRPCGAVFRNVRRL